MIMQRLSPLARGTHELRAKYSDLPRFIPAGAGNTSSYCVTLPMNEVYPRWRGEHPQVRKASLTRDGLSPLARGTRRRYISRFFPARFIPAGAGNTPPIAVAYESNAVYPRWRGEHVFRLSGHFVHSGLSPLARGTRGYMELNRMWVRFIPAGAGNTDIQRTVKPQFMVYPRWRGEHKTRNFYSSLDPGLSPLARGTHRCERAEKKAQRFIPAGAGNTSPFPAPEPSLPVYPRWRGEHGVGYLLVVT